MTGIVDMAKYLENLLKDADNMANLGLKKVYYGDRQKIPFSPIACIETGEKDRELNGHPRRTLVTIRNYVIIYHGNVRSASDNLQESDERAENVEILIHTDAQMGGLVIDSLVTNVESGYQLRDNTLFRASRLTVEARVQEQLPSSV